MYWSLTRNAAAPGRRCLDVAVSHCRTGGDSLWDGEAVQMHSSLSSRDVLFAPETAAAAIGRCVGPAEPLRVPEEDSEEIGLAPTYVLYVCSLRS